VQRPIELPVPTPVEPIAHHLPSRGRDGRHAGEHGERRLRTQPTGVRPTDQQLRDGDRPHPWLGKQHRRHDLHQRPQLLTERSGLQRPAAPARRVVGDKAEQRHIASLVGWDLELGDQPAVAVKDRGGVAVVVGVDPDDVIDIAF